MAFFLGRLEFVWSSGICRVGRISTSTLSLLLKTVSPVWVERALALLTYPADSGGLLPLLPNLVVMRGDQGFCLSTREIDTLLSG